MKVLLALEGPVEEGPNTWANNLYMNLSKRFNNKNGDTIDQVKTRNVKAFFRAFISFRKYDIFHFYSQSPGAAILFLLFKILRKKTIYTVHGNFKIEAKYKPWPINWLWIPAHLFVIKNVDVLTFPSNYIKKEVNDYLESTKLIKKSKSSQYVIHNGIHVGEYPKDFILEKLKKFNKIISGVSSLNILSLTSFYFKPKTEGIDLLVETNKILNKNGIKTEVRIGGKGHQLTEYKTRYESENIKFLGYCNIEEENKLADIFVHLSYLDNLPLVILHAGAIGLPTIASEIGGIPEIFNGSENKAIWGLTTNDAKTVAEKIIKLISDEKFYLEVSKSQYKNIKEHFHLTTISTEFWNIYKNLLKNFYL